ncbi:MAG: hypothetical protein ACRDYU_14985 [Actinomycetes bacterium]
MSVPLAPVLARAPASQPVTAWPARLALTGLVLLAVAVVFLLMWRGWQHRAARQGDVPALPGVPGDLGPILAGPDEGVYVCTTRAGDWLDRVVRHGLGVRSRAVLTVAAEGVLLARTGAPDLFVPGDRLLGARTDRGMAGKVVTGDGLLVLTWEHGGVRLDTGFRAREVARHGDLVDAARTLARPAMLAGPRGEETSP